MKRGELRPVNRPEPDPEWHDIAKMMYDSLLDSGQSDFFQSSDWAMAYHICEELSLYKQSGYWSDKTGEWVPKRNGQILAAINAAFTELLATEGARRRMRIELSEPEKKEDDAAVAIMDSYRESVKKKGKKA